MVAVFFIVRSSSGVWIPTDSNCIKFLHIYINYIYIYKYIFISYIYIYIFMLCVSRQKWYKIQCRQKKNSNPIFFFKSWVWVKAHTYNPLNTLFLPVSVGSELFSFLAYDKLVFTRRRGAAWTPAASRCGHVQVIFTVWAGVVCVL